MRHTNLTDTSASPTEARAGRTARAGTKAGRIVRFLKLVRLTQMTNRIFSLFKWGYFRSTKFLVNSWNENVHRFHQNIC